MTAIIQNPDLVTADRQSLLLSCVKSATDGLMPDGRDAALVIFNSKGKDGSGREVWMKRVQYMPMYAGILKKVRQSGEISSVVAHVVYERDKFEYVLGDNERIIHEPYMGKEARGEMIAAYCIARLKDGMIVREVMTRIDIEKVRKTSKSGNDNDGKPKGIWKDWYEEMAKKTVFRRTAKWLPQQIELVEQAFKNDDSMEVLDQVAEGAPVLMTDENTTEEGKFIPSGQPDLKLAIEEEKKKKDAGKDKKPEQNQLFNENVSQPTIGQNSIEEALKSAKDRSEVYDAWNVDFEEALQLIQRADPVEYDRLFSIYKSAMEKFPE